jgi:colicin import membrane protein
MKKSAVLYLVASLLFFSTALDAQKTAKKETKKETKKERKTTTVTKKDGSADMRYKANKEAKQSNTIAKTAKVEKKETKVNEPAAREEKKVTTTKKTSTTTATSVDKVVGKDASGRTIYEGPRGGRYYMTANGNKEYIKH